MEINLKAIDQDNWMNCIKLKVSEEQKNFVTDNAFSILQYHYDKSNYPLAIYNEEIMVGFMMYMYDESLNAYRLRRFMIDKNLQGKGYGKMALLELCKLVKEKYNAEKLYTSVESENSVAKKLYEKVGFKKTGEIRWNEEVLVVEL